TERYVRPEHRVATGCEPDALRQRSVGSFELEVQRRERRSVVLIPSVPAAVALLHQIAQPSAVPEHPTFSAARSELHRLLSGTLDADCAGGFQAWRVPTGLG